MKRSAAPLIVPYTPDRAGELVGLWRASFEHGVGVVDPHPLDEQRAYLERELVPKNEVLLALEAPGGPIVGFIAFTRDEIAALYVNVEHLGRGIGTALLDLAKARSSGKLRLFAFARNQRARAFYERSGFHVIAEGFEAHWQLADVQYEWVGEPAKGPEISGAFG